MRPVDYERLRYDELVRQGKIKPTFWRDASRFLCVLLTLGVLAIVVPTCRAMFGGEPMHPGRKPALYGTDVPGPGNTRPPATSRISERSSWKAR